MARGFLQYLQSGIVPWTFGSWCMKFVIRKCCERGHDDRVFSYVIFFSLTSLIFISMNSNVVFSLAHHQGVWEMEIEVHSFFLSY